jgi:hypothetical protein
VLRELDVVAQVYVDHFVEMMVDIDQGLEIRSSVGKQ